MPQSAFSDCLLTLPEQQTDGSLSIRAKAMLFHDPKSIELIEQVERLAASDATVLVSGESGTGKELIARHVHRRSGRKGPFLAVNCGAFSETLIDAELFGHETGAFTGAAQARAGWFEAANGGTLFLDEIGDLPLPLQVKLLRVLQERQVVRLGARKPVQLDVRLVAATNIDLQRAVDAQRFRADLYWRLSVASVELPPLRERPGDVLPLAQHFIGVYSPRLRVTHVRLSAAAEAALCAYSWPGNIRELENVIHFALIVCREGVIEPGDLKLVSAHRTAALLASAPRPGGDLGGGAVPSPMRPAAPAPAPALAPAPPPAAPTVAGGDDLAEQVLLEDDDLVTRLGVLLGDGLVQGVPSLLQRVEETLVRCAYAHCRANQVQTAQALGITRNSMRTLLKRYGLIADAAEPLGLRDAANEQSDAFGTDEATGTTSRLRSEPGAL